MSNFKRILIAIDDSPAAENIAIAGFELGKKLKAEMAVVSIAETTILMPDTGVSSGEISVMIEQEYKAAQQMLVDKIFKKQEVCLFVDNGNPHEGILRVAKEWGADLIVLGTHGRTGLSHLLMGSVAEKVVRHSSVPLFIIPMN